MFESRELQQDIPSSTNFTHHGVPSMLSEEDAINLLKSVASLVRKCEWCEVTRTLQALQFAVCLTDTPVGNPLFTRIGSPLLSRIVDTEVSPRGATLLALAVSNGAPTSVVEQLINWGANPLLKLSGKVKGGEDTDLSLLHLAFANGHLELVPLLLQVGLKADDRSGLGYDPLSYYLRSHRDSSHVDELLEVASVSCFLPGAPLPLMDQRVFRILSASLNFAP